MQTQATQMHTHTHLHHHHHTTTTTTPPPPPPDGVDKDGRQKTESLDIYLEQISFKLKGKWQELFLCQRLDLQ